MAGTLHRGHSGEMDGTKVDAAWGCPIMHCPGAVLVGWLDILWVRVGGPLWGNDWSGFGLEAWSLLRQKVG